jgi:hypothetical protein
VRALLGTVDEQYCTHLHNYTGRPSQILKPCQVIIYFTEQEALKVFKTKNARVRSIFSEK